jgi:hypothetical protein
LQILYCFVIISLMGWFSPKCPVDAETKEWLDTAFGWLVEELGIEVLRESKVVLPTEEYFPDVFDGSRASIRKMVDRVCSYMDVDPGLVALQYHENDDVTRFHPLAADGTTRSHALGTYRMRRDGRYAISLDESQISNPQTLVATIAHELGHVILLGEGRLDSDYPDHEPMTDLVTVFYGLGIFNANSSFVFEQWTNSQYQGWRAGGSGYLSEEMYGYALALFAFLRGEQKPDWAGYLNTNVRSYFKSAVKYVNENERPNLDDNVPLSP